MRRRTFHGIVDVLDVQEKTKRENRARSGFVETKYYETIMSNGDKLLVYRGRNPLPQGKLRLSARVIGRSWLGEELGEALLLFNPRYKVLD